MAKRRNPSNAKIARMQGVTGTKVLSRRNLKASGYLPQYAYQAKRSMKRYAARRERLGNPGILGIPTWAFIGIIGFGVYVAWQYLHGSDEKMPDVKPVADTVVAAKDTPVAPAGVVTVPAATGSNLIKAAMEKGTISPSILVTAAYNTGVQRVEGGPSLNTWQWNYILNMLIGASGPPPRTDDADVIKAGAYLSKLGVWLGMYAD